MSDCTYPHCKGPCHCEPFPSEPLPIPDPPPPPPAAPRGPLSDRIRPNSEAAPWVCDEVKKLEATLRAALKEREEVQIKHEVACDTIEGIKHDRDMWEREYYKARRERDAALARAEKAEGLLAEAGVMIEVLMKATSHDRAEIYARARALLSRIAEKREGGES